MQITIKELAQALNARAWGDQAMRIHGAAEPGQGQPGQIALAMSPKYAEALTPGQRDALGLLEGRTVTIGAPGSGAAVIDAEGTYARWLDAIDACYVVLRPDFYVAATAKTPEALRHRFDEVTARLHLVGEPAAVAA